MDPMFADITASLLKYIESQLTNNDVSDDDELMANFVEKGLTEEQARHALTYRDLYMGAAYLSTDTPIRQPDASPRRR